MEVIKESDMMNIARLYVNLHLYNERYYVLLIVSTIDDFESQEYIKQS